MIILNNYVFIMYFVSFIYYYIIYYNYLHFYAETRFSVVIIILFNNII